MANWTKQTFDDLIKHILDGGIINDFMRRTGHNRHELTKYKLAVPQAEHEYQEALRSRSEDMAEEILNIADNALDPHSAKNRIDARKWLAAKLYPEKFGDRIDLNFQGHISVKAALEDAIVRTKEVFELPKLVEIDAAGYKPADQSEEQPQNGSTAKNEVDDLLS